MKDDEPQVTMHDQKPEKPAPKKAAASKASEPSDDVRRAAVLCGMSYDEFLKEYGEGKVEAVLAARGRV